VTRDEFNDYVARDHHRLVEKAAFLAGSRTGAEDLLNTAVMRFCEREAWEKCPDPASVRGYLGTTMKRILIDLHTRSHKRPEYLTDSTEALDRVVDHRDRMTSTELRAALGPAVAGLPERWRQVVIHRLVLDMSIAETAATLDIPASSVASAMKRALGRLQETVTV
jgi:RNA polymerase sigma factor (sigma-70 family)